LQKADGVIATVGLEADASALQSQSTGTKSTDSVSAQASNPPGTPVP
jgi:hypothetical protein